MHNIFCYFLNYPPTSLTHPLSGSLSRIPISSPPPPLLGTRRRCLSLSRRRRRRLSLARVADASPSRVVATFLLALSLSPLTRPQFHSPAGGSGARRLELQCQQLWHDQGDDCSLMPPPFARSDDSSKLCGTAWPTTRPRPHRCRLPTTRRRSRPAGNMHRRGPSPAASAGQETRTPTHSATSASPSTVSASATSPGSHIADDVHDGQWNDGGQVVAVGGAGHERK
nr:uncharacterized protein LOC109751816 [Aegilops tauschii subsp. strangulata]